MIEYDGDIVYAKIAQVFLKKCLLVSIMCSEDQYKLYLYEIIVPVKCILLREIKCKSYIHSSISWDIFVHSTDIIGEICINHLWTNRRIFVDAHINSISCITVSDLCDIIATTSANGTLIWLWDTEGQNMREFWCDRTQIVSIAINEISTFLSIITSDYQCHIYDIRAWQNTLSYLNFLPIKYFKSEWPALTYDFSDDSQLTQSQGIISLNTISTNQSNKWDRFLSDSTNLHYSVLYAQNKTICQHFIDDTTIIIMCDKKMHKLDKIDKEFNITTHILPN